MKADIFRGSLILLLFSLFSFVEFEKNKGNVVGKYVLNAKEFLYSELTLDSSYKFEKYNSSHLAGYGKWTEYGQWELKGDSVILHVEYEKMDENEKQLKEKTIKLLVSKNKLCMVTVEFCFEK